MSSGIRSRETTASEGRVLFPNLWVRERRPTFPVRFHQSRGIKEKNSLHTGYRNPNLWRFQNVTAIWFNGPKKAGGKVPWGFPDNFREKEKLEREEER